MQTLILANVPIYVSFASFLGNNSAYHHVDATDQIQINF